MVGLSEEETRNLRNEALRDLQEQNEDLGRAYAMLHLQKIQHCEGVMMEFIDEFRDLVQKSDDGKLTAEAVEAADVVFKSVDRLDKLLTRGSKLLGLDAPIKLEASTGSDNAPDRVLNQALELEEEAPSEAEEGDFSGDLVGDL